MGLASIDLARALVTTHALARWCERVGLPAEDLAGSLREAKHLPEPTRARVWRWLTRDQWRVQCAALRHDPRTGAVFLFRFDGWWTDGEQRWKVVTVTTLDLVNATEAEACSTASQ